MNFSLLLPRRAEGTSPTIISSCVSFGTQDPPYVPFRGRRCSCEITRRSTVTTRITFSGSSESNFRQIASISLVKLTLVAM